MKNNEQKIANRIFDFRHTLIASVALIPLYCPAYAQAETPMAATTDSHSPEIIVTARKRSERLIDVPQTIQAISSDTIQKAGIANLNDLGHQTTNILLNIRSDNEPNVVIRGVGSFGNTQGIGFYIDDVQNFTDQTARIEDVERIEVLKGPQGTLYGGSNVGGAIKYIMKRPDTDAFSLDGKLSYGSFSTTDIYTAINIPVSDTLALRTSGYSHRTDGYIHNDGTGNPFHPSDEIGIRAAALWTPSADFEGYLSYRYSRLDGALNAQVPLDSVNGYTRHAAYNIDPTGLRVVHGVTLQLKGSMGGIDFYSISAYAQARRRSTTDQDYSTADALTARVDYTTKVFSQELRAQSNSNGPLDWTVGAFYSHIRDRTLNHLDIIFGPDFPGGPGVLPGYIDYKGVEETYAAFATVAYKFGAFGVDVGGRISRNEVDADIFNVGTSAAIHKTRFIPRVSLSYNVDRDVMVYANYAKGFEPGKVNTGSGFGSTAPYDAEVATNWELGIKGQTLDRKITFELAGFYIDYKDRQLETQKLINGVVEEAIFNIGDSESYGVEGSISYVPTSELTLSAGMGYLHAEWQNGEYEFQPTKGLEVPFSPSFSATGSIDWQREIADYKLGLRADVSHTGAFYWDVFNTGRSKPYTLVGATISFGDIDDKWELSLRADNIFSDKYFTEEAVNFLGASDANGNCSGCHIGYPGAPRSVTASARFSF